MLLVSFKLTMPNNNAWNGKWTGEGVDYYIIRKLKKDEQAFLAKSHTFYYNFGDGWGAMVTVEEITAQEAQKRRKNSKGFCGYDWMVESIIKNGKITIDNVKA